MRLLTTLLGLLATLMALPASAQEGLEIIGKPIDRGIGFQPAATELARMFQRLDGMVLVIITIISIFVIGLIFYAGVRFRRSANPLSPSGPATRTRLS